MSARNSTAAGLVVALAGLQILLGADRKVATVEGEPIFENELGIQSQLHQLEQQAYQLRLRAIEEAVSRRLLEKAAAAKKLSVEQLLQQEVDSVVVDPSPAEVEAFYLGQRDRLRQPWEAVREQMARNLKALRIAEARQKFIESLRARSAVAILVEPPRVAIEPGDAPRRGPASAPVTIVEFSDYQCPYCRRVAPTVREVLSRYGDQVSLVFKDLPLSIHPQAAKAAEAARCAGEQGRYWDYHDALFAASALSDASFEELAHSVGLNVSRFQECLASRRQRAAVEADVRQAQALGISGTPAFLINGILLSGAQPLEAFTRIIDSELARAGRQDR
jgi:protein-disulfide isomerase